MATSDDIFNDWFDTERGTELDDVDFDNMDDTNNLWRTGI